MCIYVCIYIYIYCNMGSQGANALQRYRNNLFVHFGLLDVDQIPPLRIRGKTSVAHPRRRSHFPT